MKPTKSKSTFTTSMGAGFALLLFLVGILVGVGYGDFTSLQEGGAQSTNPLVFAGVSAAFMIVGTWMVLRLRRKMVGHTQTLADKVFELAQGQELAPYSAAEQKSVSPEILEALRVISNNLGSAGADDEADSTAQLSQTKAETHFSNLRHTVEELLANAAEGSFKARLERQVDQPELGDFCDKINASLGKIEKSFKGLKNEMQHIASGKLGVESDADYHGDFKALHDDFNKTQTMIGQFLNDLKQTAFEVSSATTDISQGSRTLAQKVGNQSASLSDASNLMTGISESIAGSAQSVTQADGLTGQAADRADHGSQVLSDAITAMERIEGSSDRISDIISVIEGIAFQTNLLALNAAVEAARAGDAGKGFAVVASEVRNLAQRASDAAKDITNLIQQSSGDVADGVRLVKQSGDVLTEISEAVKQVAGTMSELNEASAGQTRDVTEVTNKIQALDASNIESVALAEETSTGSAKLEQEAARLSELAKRFSTEDHHDAEWEKVAKTARKAPKTVAIPAAELHGSEKGKTTLAPKSPPAPVNAAKTTDTAKPKTERIPVAAAAGSSGQPFTDLESDWSEF